MLLVDRQFIETVFVVATSRVLFLHAATVATVVGRCKKINACFLAHAIMNFHRKPGRNAQVDECQYGKKDFPHAAKIHKNMENKSPYKQDQLTNHHCMPNRNIIPCVG